MVVIIINEGSVWVLQHGSCRVQNPHDGTELGAVQEGRGMWEHATKSGATTG